MNNTKRRIFWFCAGIAATIGTLNILPESRALETWKMVEISETAPTIWELVQREYPNQDPRPIVSAVKVLNPGINIGRLQVGQAIAIPKGE